MIAFSAKLFFISPTENDFKSQFDTYPPQFDLFWAKIGGFYLETSQIEGVAVILRFALF